MSLHDEIAWQDMTPEERSIIGPLAATAVRLEGRAASTGLALSCVWPLLVALALVALFFLASAEVPPCGG